MKKRTREQWQELLVQQEASGLSAAAFCQQHDLCPKYFSLRRKQLMKNDSEVETGVLVSGQGWLSQIHWRKQKKLKPACAQKWIMPFFTSSACFTTAKFAIAAWKKIPTACMC
jgi:hypothetical protein